MKRVFDLLCDYDRKLKIDDEIRKIQGNIIFRRTGVTMEGEEKEEEADIMALKKELAEIELKPVKSISSADVYTMLQSLKQKVSRKQVEEMIWEVDEDLDGCIDWTEFRLMFTRNAIDRTGLECSKMFNLTQFLIYDHNNNGLVSVDETMNMLYAR